MPGRSDAVVGLLLVATGAASAAWLVSDLAQGADPGPLQVLARVAGATVWLGLATVVLRERWLRAGLVVAAGSLALLLLSLVVGLLATPEDFVGGTGKAPDSAAEARVLGVLLLVGVLAVGAWCARRARRRPPSGPAH